MVDATMILTMTNSLSQIANSLKSLAEKLDGINNKLGELVKVTARKG